MSTHYIYRKIDNEIVSRFDTPYMTLEQALENVTNSEAGGTESDYDSFEYNVFVPDEKALVFDGIAPRVVDKPGVLARNSLRESIKIKFRTLGFTDEEIDIIV